MIVVVCNAKGGVGKTTTAVSLAHGLANRGVRTLLVDFDPQGSCASLLGMNPEPGVFGLLVGRELLTNCIRDTGRLFLRLLPGDGRTRTAQAVLQIEISSLRDVSSTLTQLGREADIVVYDTPPSGLLQEMAIGAAGMIIIPTRCESLSVEGVSTTVAIVEQIGDEPGVVILPTSFDERLNEHRENLRLLQETHSTRIVAPVPARTIVTEAAAYGRTIWEYDHRNNMKDVRHVYSRLVSHIMYQGGLHGAY